MILTRYLYNKEYVEYSLFISLLEKIQMKRYFGAMSYISPDSKNTYSRYYGFIIIIYMLHLTMDSIKTSLLH